MRNSLYQLTLIHFREFIREPGILFWSIIFPVLMAWVLGVAFTREPQVVQDIALVGLKPSQENQLNNILNTAKAEVNRDGKQVFTKEIPDSILGKTTFRFTAASWDSAILMLKRGQISLILVETDSTLDYHLDPRSPEAKLGYMMLSSIIGNGTIVETSGTIKPLRMVGTRYIDFLLPGLIAMGLMNSMIWGICYGLIEMRVKKLLRRMVATPMKRSEFLVSLFLARFTLGLTEALILFLFAHFYFDISVQGSLTALALVFISGNIAFGGLSILLSARVENTRIGTGIINFIVMPMMVLSGIFFSYHNFPEAAVSIIRLLPLTLLADSMRSVFIEGAGLSQVYIPSLILAAFGMVLFGIGLKIYKWY
ncbi:MAG: ABC transporter permease [Bacteroidales bacterium]